MPAPPIDARTLYCAVLGHPIQHSASPAMHNAALRDRNLNWRYLAFDVHPDHLATAILGAQAMKFIGLNLTVPHKLLALSLVDVLDPSARLWGAVNTIIFEARTGPDNWKPLAAHAPAAITEIRSRGANTDADAIVRALQEDLAVNIPQATALLLGAGGAGQVAALRLAAEGAAHLYLVNRTASKAEHVQDEIRRRYPKTRVSLGYPTTAIDLVINTTSAGLQPQDPLPFNPNQFKLEQARAAYDMIYQPADTPFLQAARSAGARTANGLGMLLYQGAAAFELWTGGQPAPVPVMRDALSRHLYSK